MTSDAWECSHNGIAYRCVIETKEAPSRVTGYALGSIEIDHGCINIALGERSAMELSVALARAVEMVRATREQQEKQAKV